MLGRSGYTDVQEQEAELFASLVLHRTARRRPSPAAAGTEADADAAETAARLGSFFDLPSRCADPLGPDA